ncbi:MAG: response regulator transcription factor [Anaerovoracaceae bacterium]
MRILVVEDEPLLREAIVEGLLIYGYAVDSCGDGEAAYEQLFVENYDLVVLDINLPKMDGLTVLEKIRDEKPELKILILSARSTVLDKVNGLDLGANDYLAKPFDFAELTARIRNLLKRQFVQKSNLLSCGNMTMDLAKRIVMCHQMEIILTKKEFGLLEYFMMNMDRVISQEELIEHVWDQNVDSFSSAIRVHIATLRKKIKETLGYDPIETKIKEGYILHSKGGVANV